MALPRYSALASALVAVLGLVLYQWWIRDLLFMTLGYGRVVQPIEKSAYKCRRLEHKQLEGCGDMWLDEKYRVLYAACSGAHARNNWNPSLNRLNYNGRRAQGSELMAIYIDEPLKNGLFKMHPIQPTNYGSTPGDGKLDLSGFDVEVLDYGSTHRFWLINQRPPYDAKGRRLDAKKYGSNTTIDVYEHRKGDKKMTFIATGWSPALHSANKIVNLGSNNFAVSNERSADFGLRKKLDPILGGGSLVAYDDFFDSYRITPKMIPIPGLILRGPDDRIYVPSQVDNKIRIFQLEANGFFKQVHSIKLPMPIVGLSVDSNGDFWAVGRSKYDPTGRSSTNALFKIERFVERLPHRYVPHKLLEDGEARVLQGATIARHDVKSKRMFFGGSHMPYLVVCDKTGGIAPTSA